MQPYMLQQLETKLLQLARTSLDKLLVCKCDCNCFLKYFYVEMHQNDIFLFLKNYL